jgi:hypothetical protein
MHTRTYIFRGLGDDDEELVGLSGCANRDAHVLLCTTESVPQSASDDRTTAIH